eukprot:1877772-Prymnesium_polylepis.2
MLQAWLRFWFGKRHVATCLTRAGPPYSCKTLVSELPRLGLRGVTHTCIAMKVIVSSRSGVGGSDAL